ncbi:acetylserotonin O-methyltransferase [Frankia gtarii]|uniref:acetylserotonin O-methyltransferase n=1 Tax=Frankia gtarii TaxID=2950102 RepID=UPI0021C0EE48|nr:acetylserotonin O-methyltransferase [Frankia gtarii]
MTTPSGAPHGHRHAASRLREILIGYQITQVLYVAARLNLADHLRKPMTATDLARATGADPDTLRFLLRILVGYGVFERGGDLYATNALGQLLESDRSDSLLPTVIATGKERYSSWGSLLRTVLTGRPAFVQDNGVELHDFYAAHPAAATPFNGAMAALTNSMVDNLIDAYDFALHTRVVEVGGGLGVFMAELLHRYPTLHGVILDLPHVIAEAAQELPPRILDERLTLISGDARQNVPENADLYLIKMVLCDFSDDEALKILRSVRKAIPDDGTLVIFDKIRTEIHDDEISRRTVMSALNLLVMTGGRERSENEYRHLLTRAGFKVVDVMGTEALDGEIHRVVAKPGEAVPLSSGE